MVELDVVDDRDLAEALKVVRAELREEFRALPGASAQAAFILAAALENRRIRTGAAS